MKLLAFGIDGLDPLAASKKLVNPDRNECDGNHDDESC